MTSEGALQALANKGVFPDLRKQIAWRAIIGTECSGAAMKAIYIVRTGLPSDALRVCNVPDPVAKAGQVLISVRAFGVNFADILARTGMYLDAPRLPFIPGYEVAGIVEAVGDGVDTSRVRVGQRVAALTRFGGYAEKAIAEQSVTVPIPDAMDFAEAAAVPVNGVTAWLALKIMTTLREGDKVLVHAAAGGVGTMAVQLALAAGCEVFGTVGSEEKADFLRRIGVHHPIVHTREDVEEVVKRETAGKGLDVVLDSLGGRSVAQALRMLAPSGRLISIGIASLAPRKSRSLIATGVGLLRTPILHPYILLADSKSFIGINMKRIAEARPALLAQALRDVFESVKAGRLRPYLDSVFDFEQCAAAHERLHGRQSIGKVVVRVSGS